MKVMLILKNIYGRPLFYPNNDISELLCKFADVKAMTKRQVDCLISLKLNVEIKEKSPYWITDEQDTDTAIESL